jgi:aminoglycoside phosphotransferase (APT) family kinase protein
VALAPGTRLGPYEVVAPLGAGGMAEVYRARDTRLGREVAVKVLPPETAAVSGRLPRFEREARAVAALNHPNILALHDIGRQDEIVYAVTELLEGETLRERLTAAGRLPVLRALDYSIQIAHGLAAAHERGILHRDIKPENLFITRDGRVKILDFGLAQEAAPRDDPRATRFTTVPGTVLGTPEYMSPEQVLGQGATEQSDLFALGLVVHEMLTGAHPFGRPTMADTVTALLREDPPPITRSLPEFPTAGARLIERCLEKQASDRPASARDIAIFLEAITLGETRLSGATVPEPAARRTPSRAATVIGAAIVAIPLLMWAVVQVMAGRAVDTVIASELTHGERLLHRVQRDRFDTLLLTARLIASFPELRALFSTDPATIRDYLLSYQQQNPGTPALIATGPDGTIVARTDDLAAGAGDAGVRALFEKRGEPAVIQTPSGPQQAALAAADAGGTIFGYIVAASPVDDAFAASVREATQSEVVMLSETAVAASTLRGRQDAGRTLADWQGIVAAGGRPEVTIASRPFVARGVRLSDRPILDAILLASRDDAAAPFRRLGVTLLLVGLAFTAAAAAGAVRIARTHTS